MFKYAYVVCFGVVNLKVYMYVKVTYNQQNVSTSYIASYSCNINFRTGFMCNILNADFSSVLSLRVGSFIFKLSLGVFKS